MKRTVLLIAVLLVFFQACNEREFTWQNPVNGLELRDTHIVPDSGKFYAVGTCPPFWGGPNPGVKMYTSENLVDWQFDKLLIDASKLDSSVWYLDRFWAPELHNIGSGYYLTFNCQNSGGGGYADSDMNHFHACGVATASEITGPYTVRTHEKPLTPFPSNDLSLFEDDNGKVYAFFNNGWTDVHKIFVAEFDTASCRLTEDPVELLSQSSTEGEWDAAGIEGAHVIRHNGTYYLFYSSWTRGYAVGYATANNIYGPWKKYGNNPLFGAYSDGEQNYIIRNGQTTTENDSPIINAGHNQIFKGPDERLWTSYHAYLDGRDEPVTFIDPIWFEEGLIKTTAPSYNKHTVDIPDITLNKFPGLAEGSD